MYPFYPLGMQTIYQPIIIESGNSLLQNFVAISAVVISLIALFVSLWSLRVQRKHNKKTVRPAGHVQLHDSLQGLCVRIVNKGCGPMYIKEFTAVQNEIIKHNIVYHLPDVILNGITHQTHTEPEGYWLVPGEELVLLKLQGDHTDQRFVQVRDSVRLILSQMVVRLTFCDVYDQTHPVFEKSLSWYRRNL